MNKGHAALRADELPSFEPVAYEPMTGPQQMPPTTVGEVRTHRWYWEAIDIRAPEGIYGGWARTKLGAIIAASRRNRIVRCR